MAKKKEITPEGKWTGESKKEEKSSKTQKNSLESLSQTHGKEENFKATTLDQVWGDDGNWKYDTMDDKEYEKELNNMVKSDLQTHATKIGIIPIDNRPMLTQRLVREFKKHVSIYESTAVRLQEDKVLLDAKDKDVNSEIQKILEEGK